MVTQISTGSLYSNIWTSFHEIISGNVVNPSGKSTRWIYGSMPRTDAKNFKGYPLIIINNPTVSDNHLTAGSAPLYDIQADVVIDMYAEYSAHTAQINDNLRRTLKNSAGWSNSGTTFAGIYSVDFGTSDNATAQIGKKIVHVSSLPVSFKVSH